MSFLMNHPLKIFPIINVWWWDQPSIFSLVVTNNHLFNSPPNFFQFFFLPTLLICLSWPNSQSSACHIIKKSETVAVRGIIISYISMAQKPLLLKFLSNKQKVLVYPCRRTSHYFLCILALWASLNIFRVLLPPLFETWMSDHCRGNIWWWWCLGAWTSSVIR